MSLSQTVIRSGRLKMVWTSDEGLGEENVWCLVRLKAEDWLEDQEGHGLESVEADMAELEIDKEDVP